jgi:hypothetical protein
VELVVAAPFDLAFVAALTDWLFERQILANSFDPVLGLSHHFQIPPNYQKLLGCNLQTR